MNGKNPDNTDAQTSTLANGMQLLALICAGINRLKLNKPQILRWTNRVSLLDEWLKLLSTDWIPQGTTTVTSKEEGGEEHVFSLTDLKLQTYCSHELEETLFPWIQEFHRQSIGEILSTHRLPEEEKPADRKPHSVFKCEIVGKVLRGVQLLRQIFAFNGLDETLLKAFAARNVVWEVEDVLGLIANVIHDPDNDPLLLAETGTSIFPVYTGSIYTDKRLDSQKIQHTVKLMEVGRTRKKHLGKHVWEFRVFHTLRDLMCSTKGLGDPVICDWRNTIFFKNSPLPQKQLEYQEWDPALHG